MRERNLEHRIRRLEKRLKPPALPTCEVCDRQGGMGIVTEEHLYPSGSVTWNGSEIPPCAGCMRVNDQLKRPSKLIICHYYSDGAEGESCPICKEPSLATVRAQLASGELSPSQVRMIQVGANPRVKD